MPTTARTRPDWDTYFMDMAKLAARRSSCLRRSVGAVIVKDRRLLSTGYNGVPSGVTHCEVVGCLRERLNVPSGERHELCRGLHAEQRLQAGEAELSIQHRGLVAFVGSWVRDENGGERLECFHEGPLQCIP